jgi:hypothetical protein
MKVRVELDVIYCYPMLYVVCCVMTEREQNGLRLGLYRATAMPEVLSVKLSNSKFRRAAINVNLAELKVLWKIVSPIPEYRETYFCAFLFEYFFARFCFMRSQSTAQKQVLLYIKNNFSYNIF